MLYSIQAAIKQAIYSINAISIVDATIKLLNAVLMAFLYVCMCIL